MATRYEIAAHLIRSEADNYGDEGGWHWVLLGILRELQDSEKDGQSAEVLREEIFDRIMASTAVKTFEELDALDEKAEKRTSS